MATEAKIPRELLERRWDAVSSAMDAAGYDAVIVAGRGLVGQYGDVCYLTGVPLFGASAHGYAFIRPGRPVQLVVADRDRELVRSFGANDLLWPSEGGGYSPGEAVCALIDEHGVSRGRVGVVGLEFVLPMCDWMLLSERHPRAVFESARDLIAPIKAVKSPVELELYRATCSIADEAFDVFHGRVRVGRTEAELAAAVEEAARRRGALATIVQVLTGRMYGRPPIPQPLGDDQLVCCIAEVAGPSGYWVEKGAMFALGNPPDRWLEMAAALERAFTIGEAMLTGGTRASEIAAVVSRIASEAGYRVGISSGHGAGMDSDLPALTGDDDRPLEPGMVICLHPHLCDERYGAFAIDQYTITEGPPQRHSRFARCLYHR